MASKTSCRWTGTSLGATMPSRTLSPRISTTVTVMSLLITMLSFFFLDSTSIGAYPFLSLKAVRVVRLGHDPQNTVDTQALHDEAREDSPLQRLPTYSRLLPASVAANGTGKAEAYARR